MTGDGNLPEGCFLFRYLPPPLTSAGRRGRRPLQRQTVRLRIAANLRGGLGAGRPTSRCRLTTHTKQKAGANISFAPAVLLLRSHSLITLTRYFSDCTLVFIRIILTLRFCLTLSGSQFTCSLVLPSGSLFAEKHLWNVVKSVRLLRSFLGYRGLMLRTAPLNSSTLECLLVDQMKFRFFLFGGVVTVIATDLLSS